MSAGDLAPLATVPSFLRSRVQDSVLPSEDFNVKTTTAPVCLMSFFLRESFEETAELMSSKMEEDGKEAVIIRGYLLVSYNSQLDFLRTGSI